MDGHRPYCKGRNVICKEREYVLYAKVSGQKSLMIIVRHIIPNILSTIIIAATLTIATSILMESSLSF